MKKLQFLTLFVAIVLTLSGCVRSDTLVNVQSKPSESVGDKNVQPADMVISGEDKVIDMINHPAFEGFGRFLFPTEQGNPDKSMELNELEALLPYHNNIDTETTIEVIDYMLDEVNAGETIFYDIYTDADKQSDPTKENTGLFFFRGEANAPLAIICAGGGFSYVGSIHESFPHALELSKRGYNAFAIQYRTGGANVACEDLAAAISFIFEHADSLQVSTEGYSLWGGSAGARMAAYLGSYGPSYFGGGNYPKPGTVVMQYTGHSDYTDNEPPTFVVVGENDGIASWRTMEQRVNALKAAGVDTEFYKYPNLGHGFGLGIGTTAEGWFDDAVTFWEKHLSAPQEDTVMPVTDKGRTTMQEVTYLWEEGNVPASTVYPENSSGYFDPPDFRPNMVYVPAKEGVEVKGAILICAGGAFQFRAESDGFPVAERLSELGYQSFIVNYRLHPYTMQEGSLDLARAVRHVRNNAAELGIDQNHIAVIGFSAGGILCGDLLLNFDGLVNGTSIDERYMPDQLDHVSADANAVAMIYSFYGKLSVASTNVEKFRESDLPPTYFLYGSEEVFRNQIEACARAVEEAGVPVETKVLQGWQHGFGARGDWFEDFDRWLNWREG